MVDDARPGAAAAAYRGFLFSDMRGFTAFAERHGNTAAAEKVRHFLDLARAAIAKHEGAEVKTEGDAIHAVFPSASSAVLCGLEIQDAARELNAKEPERPLNLGVGVHAGEAVETAEGYIGRAVNIAARLCAEAKPGEVLVSSTVKGITQASIQVGFIPRGNRRLKGIADPIVVYAVTRDLTAKAPRSVPRPFLLGAAGVAIVAVLALTVVFASQLLAPKVPGSSPGGSTPPSAASGALPVRVGRLDVGSYVSQAFQPAVTFTIGDQGWTANRDLPNILGLVRDVAPIGSIYFFRVEKVVAQACSPDAEGAATGPSATSLLTQLENLQHLTVVSERTPVEVGGIEGQQITISVDPDALSACSGLVGAEVPIFVVGTEVWGAAMDEVFTVISLPVGETPVTIVLATNFPEPQTLTDVEALRQVQQSVLDHVEF